MTTPFTPFTPFGLSCSCGASIMVTPGSQDTTDHQSAYQQLLARFRLTHDRTDHEVTQLQIRSTRRG